MSGWADLAQRLRQQYPATWDQRLQRLKAGEGWDLRRWRALGQKPPSRTQAIHTLSTGPSIPVESAILSPTGQRGVER